MVKWASAQQYFGSEEVDGLFYQLNSLHKKMEGQKIAKKQCSKRSLFRLLIAQEAWELCDGMKLNYGACQVMETPCIREGLILHGQSVSASRRVNTKHEVTLEKEKAYRRNLFYLYLNLLQHKGNINFDRRVKTIVKRQHKSEMDFGIENIFFLGGGGNRSTKYTVPLSNGNKLY